LKLNEYREGFKIAKDKKPKDEPISGEPSEDSIANIDIDKILEEREKLDALLRKVKKTITVMFTDLTDSTGIAERVDQFTFKNLLRHNARIVSEGVKEGNGILVKTEGDGTMSYFYRSQDAVRTAVQIQKQIADFDKQKVFDFPIQIRIGLHTGEGIVDKRKNDISGDVVNTAKRFETLAETKQILLSEKTYNALRDKEEIYCRCIKTDQKLKGKSNPVKVYKAFWDKKEIEEDKQKAGEVEKKTKEETALPIVTVEESRKPSLTNRVEVGLEGYTYSQTPAEVAAEVAGRGPCLVVQREEDDKVVAPIDKDELTMGRSSDCDITLDERYVSRKHARVYREQDSFWVEDLKSSLGVSVNGKRITKEQLQNGDEIKFGAIRIIFANPPAVPTDEETTKMDVTMVVPTVDDEATMKIESQPRYKLVVSSADGAITEHEIPPDGLVLGRSTACEVLLKDPMVSRRHAKVFLESNSLFVEDIGSNNGTFVDRKRIQPEQKVELKEKQLITIGDLKLTVVNAAVNADKSLFADTASSFSKGLGRLWGRDQK